MNIHKQILLSITLFFTIVTTSFAYGTFSGPSGLITWNQKQAEDGYILFSVSDRTFLINMAGQLINEWDLPGSATLLDNGHILSLTSQPDDNSKTFVEQDWNGKTVWQYHEERSDYDPHHDFMRIHNQKLGKDTLLFIANKKISSEILIELGANPDQGPYRNVTIDTIVEIDLEGNVVWEWSFADHLIAGNTQVINSNPQLLNINLPGKPLTRDWLHSNSLDYNQKLGQIVINSVHGEFYVIDHDNTFISGDPQKSIALAASSKGDFLYRFGDPARYEQGDRPHALADWNLFSLGHKQLGRSHSVSWIPNDYSGAGNFLIFNNGNNMYQPIMPSTIIEVNPYLNSSRAPTSDYVNPPDAGYFAVATNIGNKQGVNKLVSNQIVWDFIPKSHQSFYSLAGSHAQRLKNGDTFACANQEGHFIEINREGKIVWEYINPMLSESEAIAMVDSQTQKPHPARCGGKYSSNYPGLQNVDLTPGPTLLNKYSNSRTSIISLQNKFFINILIFGVGLFIGYIFRKK